MSSDQRPLPFFILLSVAIVVIGGLLWLFLHVLVGSTTNDNLHVAVNGPNGGDYAEARRTSALARASGVTQVAATAYANCTDRAAQARAMVLPEEADRCELQTVQLVRSRGLDSTAASEAVQAFRSEFKE